MAWAGGYRRGDREARPPVFFRPNWGLEGRKIFFRRPGPPPFTKGLDDRPPPLSISRSASGTVSEARYDYIHNISTDNRFDSVAVIHRVTQLAHVVYSVPQCKRRRTTVKKINVRWIPKFCAKLIKPKAQLPIKIPRSCLSITQTAAILFSEALSRI